MKNQAKGITLIALVITIIVLLILAGVSLSLVMGEEGMIGRAISAKEVNENAEEKELVELAVSTAQIDGNGMITTTNLNNALQETFHNETETTEDGDEWEYEAKKLYKIYPNGKFEEIERALPAGYQQVDYLESTGNQWIDTGIIPNNNTKLEIEGAFLQGATSYSVCIGGSCKGNTAPKSYFGPAAMTTGGKGIYFYYNSFHQFANISYGDRFNAIIESKNGEGIHSFFNETTKQQYNNTVISEVETDRSIYLFALMLDTGIVEKCYGRIYFCNIEKDNKKVREFIPCKCTTAVTDESNKQCPEGTRGLYDLVTKKFYTNLGTGADFKIPGE